MCDNGDPEDKPPAPPVRMSSTIFSTGSGKDSLSANHSSKPLPSVPEERKPRNKIISIFSGAEKGQKCLAEKYFNLQYRTYVINVTTSVHITAGEDLHNQWWYKNWENRASSVQFTYLHSSFSMKGSVVCECVCNFGLFQAVERKIETKNDLRSPHPQILNTPYMLVLMLSLGSSLWVFTAHSHSFSYVFLLMLLFDTWLPTKTSSGSSNSAPPWPLHRACQSNGLDYSRHQTSPSQSRRKTPRLCSMF